MHSWQPPREKLLNRQERQELFVKNQMALGVSDLLLLRHSGMRWNDELTMDLQVIYACNPTENIHWISKAPRKSFDKADWLFSLIILGALAFLAVQ